MATTPTANEQWQYGLYYVTFARRNSSGYPVGLAADPENLTADTIYHAFRSNKPIEVTFPQETYETATERSGMATRGQADLGVADWGTGTLVLSRFMETLNAQFTQSTADTTSTTNWMQIARNILQTDLSNWFIMFTSRSQDTSGNSWYNHWVFPNVQIRRPQTSLNQSGGQNPQTFTHEFVPTLSDRALTGELFSGMSMTQVDDKDTQYYIRTQYPLHITTWIADGTETTFETQYVPVSTAVDQSDHAFTKNGTTTNPSSLVVATGQVTVAAAGSSGDVHIAVYQDTNVAV